MKTIYGPSRAFGAVAATVAVLAGTQAMGQTTYPALPATSPPAPVGTMRAGRPSAYPVQLAQVPAPATPPPPSIPAPVIPPPPVSSVAPPAAPVITPAPPGTPTDPIAPGVAPTAPIDSSNAPVGEGNQTDLSIPRAASESGGGGPTGEQAKEEAAAEKPDVPLLTKFLGREDKKIKIYGWIQNSFTGNANGGGNGQNFGVNPNFKANQWMGNQYYLIFEKPLEQNDEINFGFRVDNLFGNDWTFNHSRGFLDTQNRAGLFAGYDMAQVYADVHLPIITKGGFDVRVGRFYTIAGYEQVPAISRPLLSVPYMFNYGQPFTHLGVLTTLHVTDKLNFYNGAINGWDRWFDQRYNMGYIGGINYTFNEDKTNLALTFVAGPNQFPSFVPAGQNIQPTGTPVTPAAFAGQRNTSYGSDWRYTWTSVLTHKWNDKLTQVLETDESFEKNIAFLGPNAANGGRKDAQWYSFGNWFLYAFNDKLTGVVRSEVFWDPSGVRTGTTGGRFYEETLGLIYKPKSWLWIRPEARYDWSQFVHPYSNGTRSSQLTLAFDVILLF